MRSYPVTRSERPDLSPVFGRLERDVEDRVLGHLLVARERVLALQNSLAERTGSRWDSPGVEVDVFESGQASISAYVETATGAGFEMTFSALLCARNFIEHDPDPETVDWQQPPTRRVMATDAWDVEGSVDVYPDACFRPQVAAVELPARRYHEPADAAAAFAALWTEMAELASSRPLDAASWPPLGPRGG